MNCENCPFRFTENCKLEYFNGLPVCTAYFNGKGWTSTDHIPNKEKRSEK